MDRQRVPGRDNKKITKAEVPVRFEIGALFDQLISLDIQLMRPDTSSSHLHVRLTFLDGREVNVGEYDSITGLLDLTRGEALLWKGRSPPKDRTVRIIKHSTVDITLYAVLASAASVGIVLASIFLAINIRYRNQR